MINRYCYFFKLDKITSTGNLEQGCQAPVRFFVICQYIGRQWRSFVPYLCQLIFAAILQVKLWKSFVTAIALNYALLLSQ